MTLPLFPLGAVLFPGLVMPLRIFEERYKTLVRDLQELPAGQREFGVVAIRHGHEVGADGAVSLYEVGCTAQVREVTRLPDGRFDLVTVGRRRFEISRVVPAPTPYLQAEVTFLPEHPGTDAEALAALVPRVLATFRDYLGLLRGGGALTEQLPDDPQVLSHMVATTAVLTIAERQELLAAPDTATRLRTELRLLRRESALLRQLRAVPVPLSELPSPSGPN